jgi:hypothetical protein
MTLIKKTVQGVLLVGYIQYFEDKTAMEVLKYGFLDQLSLMMKYFICKSTAAVKTQNYIKSLGEVLQLFGLTLELIVNRYEITMGGLRILLIFIKLVVSSK